MLRKTLVPETVLLDLLAHASSGTRIVGHLDDARAIIPLADHIDAIDQETVDR